MGKKYEKYQAAIEYLKEYDKLPKVLQSRKEMLLSNAVPSEYKSLANKIIEKIDDLKFYMNGLEFYEAYADVNYREIELSGFGSSSFEGKNEPAKEKLASEALNLLKERGIDEFREKFNFFREKGKEIAIDMVPIIRAMDRSKSQFPRATAGPSSQPRRGAVAKSRVPKGLRTGKGKGPKK